MADPKSTAKIRAIVVRGSYSYIESMDKDGLAVRREVYPNREKPSEATVMVTEAQLVAAHGVLVPADKLNEELVRVRAEGMSGQSTAAEATEPPTVNKRGRSGTTDE